MHTQLQVLQCSPKLFLVSTTTGKQHTPPYNYLLVQWKGYLTTADVLIRNTRDGQPARRQDTSQYVSIHITHVSTNENPWR